MRSSAAARGLAECCAEWANCSPNERHLLQVKVRPPRKRSTVAESQDVDMVDGPGPAMSSHPTPELVASHEDDSMSIDLADPRDMLIDRCSGSHLLARGERLQLLGGQNSSFRQIAE